METILEVVNENLVWFIGGGVVLLLAVIGLISEKSKKKQDSNEPKEEKVEEIKEDSMATPVEETVSEEKKADAENLFGATAATEETKFNLYGSQNEETSNNMFEQPVVESAADSVSEVGFEPQSLNEVTETTNVSEDLFAPFGETSVVEETPIVEETTIVEETPIVEMPKVETEEETENRF